MVTVDEEVGSGVPVVPRGSKIIQHFVRVRSKRLDAYLLQKTFGEQQACLRVPKVTGSHEKPVVSGSVQRQVSGRPRRIYAAGGVHDPHLADVIGTKVVFVQDGVRCDCHTALAKGQIGKSVQPQQGNVVAGYRSVFVHAFGSVGIAVKSGAQIEYFFGAHIRTYAKRQEVGFLIQKLVVHVPLKCCIGIAVVVHRHRTPVGVVGRRCVCGKRLVHRKAVV